MKRMLTIVTVIIGLALSHCMAFADMPPPKDKNENPNIAAARKSIEAKDFKAAVGQLTKAVQEEPKNADAHTMLGYSYRKLGTFDKSMENYQTALKIDSNHRSAHEYLGELYLDMNQPASAENQLQVLKKACPFFGKCAEYKTSRKPLISTRRKILVRQQSSKESL